MPSLSIIVPVYKVEKYLRKCVDSILAQTFRDFELILVDDGSPDNCGAICDEYATKDDRVKVLHKENGGLSDARNKGLSVATGEYVGFVDSDDYIENDMYETLVNNIKKYDADVSICGFYNCFSGNKYPLCESKEFMVLNNVQALRTAMEGLKFSVTAWDKIYRKDMFEKITFPEGRLAEDAAVIPSILANAKTVVATTEPKYNYVHRKQSITGSNFKQRDLDVLYAYQKNYDMISKKFPDLIDVAEFRLIWANMYLLDKIVSSDTIEYSQEYRKISKDLKKNIFKILKNPIFSFKRKFAMVVFYFSKTLYIRMVIKNNKDKMSLFE